MIIGVASEMDLATLETMGYGFSALVRSGSVISGEQTLLLRVLLSPAGHVAWTGLQWLEQPIAHVVVGGLSFIALLITIRRVHREDRTGYHRGAIKGR